MINVDDFTGRPFDWETANCYSLVRDVYKRTWGVALRDYACPTNWWHEGLNFFIDHAADEGFKIVNSHPRDWLPGDVILMAIDAPVANHSAVLLANQQILHHLVDRLSGTTSYGGSFRNNTVAVYRHSGVPSLQSEVAVDFRDLLSPHARRLLEQAVS